MNAYLFFYVSRQFGGAWIQRELTPFKVEIPTPTDSEVKAAVEIIKKAERPVLLLGSQSVLPTTKPADLQEIVKVFLSHQVLLTHI